MQLRGVRARVTVVLLRTDMALAQVHVRFSLHLLTRLAHLCLSSRLVAVVWCGVSGGWVGRGGCVGFGSGRFVAGAAVLPLRVVMLRMRA